MACKEGRNQTCRYRCYSQLNKGANKISEGSVGYCNIHSVCGWKLELMDEMIFRKILNDEKLFGMAVKRFMESGKVCAGEAKQMRTRYQSEVKAISGKISRLIEMRVNGELNKEEYLAMRKKFEEEKQQAEQYLLEYDRQSSPKACPITDAEAKERLRAMINAGGEHIEELVGIFVSKIKVVNEMQFEWYLSFDSKDGITEENSFNLVVKYKDALAFRKKRKELLRQNQWSDLKVEVLY